jgi:hypothetical protein
MERLESDDAQHYYTYKGRASIDHQHSFGNKIVEERDQE